MNKMSFFTLYCIVKKVKSSVNLLKRSKTAEKWPPIIHVLLNNNTVTNITFDLNNRVLKGPWKRRVHVNVVAFVNVTGPCTLSP